MITPQVLVTGSFGPEDIEITVSESTLVVSNETKQRIENIWNAKEQEAKEKDPNLYNGMSYRLNSWLQQDGRLELDFGLIDYKTRLGLVLLSGQQVFTEQEQHKGCFVGGSVQTSDGYYVMLKLTGKSMNLDTTEVIGGITEDNIPIDQGPYLYSVMYEELEEEAGITVGDVKNISIDMMYTDSHYHTGFYFTVDLSITRKELESRFVDNNDVDVDSLLLYTKDEYVQVMQDHNTNKQLMIINLLNMEAAPTANARIQPCG